jgi:hypothetical protein
MVELVIGPLADAFMQVGVFVALLVAPFGWARYRWGHQLDDLLLRHRRLAPAVAAALTMPPGCGGAIVVMALYARGAVSYGTAIAALVATMGDASWVLLAGDPVLTVQLKLLMLLTGTACGYGVDALGIAPSRKVDLLTRDATARPAATRPAAIRAPSPAEALVATWARPARVQLHALGVLPALIWVLVGAGATVSLPVTFQLLDPSNAYLVLGTTGTAIALVAFLRGGGKLADDDARTAQPSSMTEVLRHSGHEVAFVTVWVAAAYVGYSLFTHATGFDGSELPLFGLAGVVVGALVGLIPGCGVQIIFCGIFLAGGMPLPTLVANTVSQDGDALIPLLALEHRSALLATVLTTVPALLLGSAFLVLT